jgi:hypothetical protein
MCTLVQAQYDIIDHNMQAIQTARKDLTEVNSNVCSLLTSGFCDEVSFTKLAPSLEMDIAKQVGVAKGAIQQIDYETIQFNATDFTGEFTQQLSTWSVTTKQKVILFIFKINAACYTSLPISLSRSCSRFHLLITYCVPSFSVFDVLKEGCVNSCTGKGERIDWWIICVRDADFVCFVLLLSANFF